MYEGIEHLKPFYEAQVNRVLQRVDPKEYGYDLRNCYGNIKVKNLKPFELTERNRDLLKQYNSHMIKQGISPARKSLMLGVLARLLEKLGKDFDEATKEDILGIDPQQKGAKQTVKDLLSKIMELQISDTTKSDYLKKLKQFDKWFNGGECSYRTNKMKTSIGNKTAKLPDQLLTPAEVETLLKATYTIRDKALIHLLWESGARVGEIINLKINSVQINKGEGRLNLYGKKGGRSIFILESVKDLTEYLKTRQKDDPAAPLFILHEAKSNVKPLNHSAIARMLEEMQKRAGITKHVHAYLFRHSRASYLASRGLNEATLCSIFGWEIGSKQVRVYIHLSGKQVEDAYKSLYGIVKPEMSYEKKQKCQICGELNQSDVDVCESCYNPLTITGALRVRKENEHLQEAVQIQTQVNALAFELIQQGLTVQQAKEKAVIQVAEQFANKLKEEQKVKAIA